VEFHGDATWIRYGSFDTAAALCHAQTPAQPMPMRMHRTPTFEEIAAALEANVGAAIVDVGAGSGLYTLSLLNW
jgi:hypothetical protein